MSSLRNGTKKKKRERKKEKGETMNHKKMGEAMKQKNRGRIALPFSDGGVCGSERRWTFDRQIDIGSTEGQRFEGGKKGRERK